MSEYVVIIEKASDVWGAYSPDLSVYATASSRKAVERKVRDAIAFHVEALREQQQPVPKPASEAITVGV